MNVKDRDELLIRTDERVGQLLDLTQKQEEHLFRINSTIQKHDRDIAVIKAQRKMGKKELGGIGAVVTGLIVALWKAFTGQ